MILEKYPSGICRVGVKEFDGEKLRLRRKQSGFTRTELAALIGVAGSECIRGWELGHTKPTRMSIERIMKETGWQVGELLITGNKESVTVRAGDGIIKRHPMPKTIRSDYEDLRAMERAIEKQAAQPVEASGDGIAPKTTSTGHTGHIEQIIAVLQHLAPEAQIEFVKGFWASSALRDRLATGGA